MDVSLRSCAVCVVDDKGIDLHERDLPCEIEKIGRYLTALPVSVTRIGFGSGTLSRHLFYGLKAEGFDVVCMEARQVSDALSAMRNKTDRNDARGIAQILRTGWFSAVHMKSREAHGVRALLSTRKALRSKTINLANEVCGLLKTVGICLPRTVKHGSFDGVVRPMIEMDEVLAHAMLPLLDARLVLYQHFQELDRRVKRAARQNEVCMRMMTVPGVGPIAALTFKAAVDAPARFKGSRAHFGPTSRRYQAGEHDNPCRISKAWDRNVRATLYAAANVLLMRTKGRHRAFVAVARNRPSCFTGCGRMAPSSVQKKWRACHDLPPDTNLNGIVLTGRGSWMKPKMSAALSSASQSEVLHSQSDTCVKRCPPRRIKRTAKRSVTRMSDNDPNQQEKRA